MSATSPNSPHQPEVKLIQALILATKEVLGTMARVDDVRRIGLSTDQPYQHLGGMASLVDMNGAVQGWIALDLKESLATILSAKMLGEPPESLAPEDVEDTVKELSNMISGSAKRLLAENSDLSLRLSIPTALKSAQIPELLSHGALPITVAFEAENQPFWLVVHYLKNPDKEKLCKS